MTTLVLEPPKPKKTAKPNVASWRGGSKGFLQWLEDVQPRILDHKKKWVPFEFPSEELKAEICKAIDSGARTIVFCWPRRHGKTLVSALIIAWRFSCNANEAIGLISNSKTQTVSTCFKLIKGLLLNTPYYRELVSTSGSGDKADKDIFIGADFINWKSLGNEIKGYSSGSAGLYGIKMTLGQASELHAADSDENYNIVKGSTSDTEDGLVIVDSTVGSKASPLYGLWNAWQEGDAGTHFSYVCYQNLEEAIAKLPKWINEQSVRSLAKTMLPQVFAQQHLNLWASGTSALFAEDDINKCVENYPFDPATIANGAAFKVGAGLDRAYGFSLHGDRTISSCVVKFLRGEEECFYVLDSNHVKFSSAEGIKTRVRQYAKDWELSNFSIESFNAQDILAWAQEQKFQAELVHATPDKQSNIFTHLYNLVREHRLRIHPSFTLLRKEMADFTYKMVADGNNGFRAKFEAARGAHDDTVYSLAWAVYSLRNHELPAYELPGIICDAPSLKAQFCILHNGDHVPPCADGCRSMMAVQGLYARYLSRADVTPLSIKDFSQFKITNTGPVIRKR